MQRLPLPSLACALMAFLRPTPAVPVQYFSRLTLALCRRTTARTRREEATPREVSAEECSRHACRAGARRALCAHYRPLCAAH